MNAATSSVTYRDAAVDLFWGFKPLQQDKTDIENIWAVYIYGEPKERRCGEKMKPARSRHAAAIIKYDQQRVAVAKMDHDGKDRHRQRRVRRRPSHVGSGGPPKLGRIHPCSPAPASKDVAKLRPVSSNFPRPPCSAAPPRPELADSAFQTPESRTESAAYFKCKPPSCDREHQAPAEKR